MSVSRSTMRALARATRSPPSARVGLSSLAAARPTVAVASKFFKQSSVASMRFYSEGQGQGEVAASPSAESIDERTMFIGNMDYALSNEDIKREVGQLGTIENIMRINRGSCRIVFSNPDEMEAAASKINGSFWRGRRIYASKTRPGLGRNEGQQNPTRTLFIGNIPNNATDLELSELVGNVGRVPFLRLMRDSQTGGFRGFGYMDFFTVEEAQRAKELLQGRTIRGFNVRVNYAATNEKSAALLDERMRVMAEQGVEE